MNFKNMMNLKMTNPVNYIQLNFSYNFIIVLKTLINMVNSEP